MAQWTSRWVAMAAVSQFYGTAAAAMMALWATLSVGVSDDFHARVSRVAVVTRCSADADRSC